MKKIMLFTLGFLVFIVGSYGQTGLKLQEMIDQHKKDRSFFVSSPIFSFKNIGQTEQSKYFNLQLNDQLLQDIYDARPSAMLLSLPKENGQEMVLELVEVFPIKNGAKFSITSREGKKDFHYEPGHYYRGYIQGIGNRKSLAVISVFTNGIMGMISEDGVGNWNLGPAANDFSSQSYVLSNDRFNRGTTLFSCGNSDYGNVSQEVSDAHNKLAKSETVNCIDVYLVSDNDLYIANGSDVWRTMNYITAMWNQSQTLYLNDNINVRLSGASVWDTPDGFSEVDSDAALDDFIDNIGSNFDGDVAELLAVDDVTSGGKSGLAIDIGFSCNSDDNRHCYCDLYVSFGIVPSYSWDINVMTHELGHLFGSRHTHACVWNGDDTAIDGCSGAVEGSCSLPGNPAGGGTIMSYCHNTGVGMNFTLGFGPQPLAVISNYVDGKDCLGACNCPANIASGSIPAVITVSSPAELEKYEASSTIESNSTINAGTFVKFDAGESIRFTPGFWARAGCIMHAFIEGCGGLDGASVTGMKQRAEPSGLLNDQGSFLTVFPNPGSTETLLSFSLPANTPAHLWVTNLHGQMIQEWKVPSEIQASEQTLRFDLADLPAGLYFCILENGLDRHIKKLVVNKL